MRIYDLKTNRLENPIGFSLDRPRLSYKVDQTEAKAQVAAQIRVAQDPGMEQLLFDSGRSGEIDSLCFLPELTLAPRTRYWWDVRVWADNGEEAASAPAFFETGKMDESWTGRFITADLPGNLVLSRSLYLERVPEKIRIYCTGVGLYELYINGEKVGDELLAPFYNAYDRWIQVVTHEADGLLRPGENQISVMLGDGWYKGRFGFQGEDCLYGDTQAFLMELYGDEGDRPLLSTDAYWMASDGPVRAANIYDGETYDATFAQEAPRPAALYEGLPFSLLKDRLSPPVRVTQRLTPADIFTTPAGETVLDLGQEITGYLEFTTAAPRGTKLSLSYFEILQDGNFYRDNLRSARQEFHYTADGEKRVVRPHFTFYGFRYVKLEGFAQPRLSDFCGCVVHTDLPLTSTFTSGNEKVNRLAQNVIWGQRGNFLDVPTDCPQRDERMGWTGDAQAFSGTACFQMDAAAFYQKYLFDMKCEQDKRSGSVPHVVPDVKLPGDGSCAWADAATIIPWTLYTFFGDRELLKAQYGNMRDWVEWIYRVDEASGGRRLWDVGFHFADWLALDSKDGTPFGGTDPHFVATAYYYYSTSLLLKAARALEYAQDVARYEKLQGQILAAIEREYFTPGGRLAQTTQTGYICALFMAFAPPQDIPRLTRLLEREFEQTHGQLRTGFVGTTYLCRTLSMVGLNELAYSLLLGEEYPGWLYEVNMGATTIWERWNSVLPDGRISDTGMNSLNHYTYGAVMEWVFRDVAGLNPLEEAPGFRRVLLRPRPDIRLPKIDFAFESPVGRFESAWEIEDRQFTWEIAIPFGARAQVVFPNADLEALAAAYPQKAFRMEEGRVTADLPAGRYRFTYAGVRPFAQINLATTLKDLLAVEEVARMLSMHLPGVLRETRRNPRCLEQPLREVIDSPHSEVPVGAVERFQEALSDWLCAL